MTLSLFLLFSFFISNYLTKTKTNDNVFHSEMISRYLTPFLNRILDFNEKLNYLMITKVLQRLFR